MAGCSSNRAAAGPPANFSPSSILRRKVKGWLWRLAGRASGRLLTRAPNREPLFKFKRAWRDPLEVAPWRGNSHAANFDPVLAGGTPARQRSASPVHSGAPPAHCGRQTRAGSITNANWVGRPPPPTSKTFGRSSLRICPWTTTGLTRSGSEKAQWWKNPGNWEVKRDLYPQGFKPISDLLHSSGRARCAVV